MDGASPTSVSRPGAGLWRCLVAAFTLALLALMFGRSMMRPFDMDEHQFVAPSQFLNETGALPYRDYPYFHMPHLIYIHAAAMKWVPYKLLAARTVSVLCGWGTVLLLAAAGWGMLKALPGRTRCLLVGGFLAAYLCSQLFAYTNGWAWNHDAAMFCAVAAFLVQCRAMKSARLWLLAAAGALAGLAIGIRLSYALIVVPMGVWIFVGPTAWTRRGRTAGLALAVLAALTALVPALVPWADDPTTFVFGNLGYAELSRRFYANMNEGYASIPAKFGYLFRKFLSDPGNAFLFLTGGYALAVAYWKHRAWRTTLANELGLLFALMPALLIGVWGPTPTQQQYFFMLLPFLALAGMAAAALDCGSGLGLIRWRRVVIWAALAPAVIGLPRWYWPVVFAPDVERWTPVQVHRIGEWVRAECGPDARVLTADPLFALEGHMRAYPEYAVGRFIFHVGPWTDPASRGRLKIAYGDDLERMLASRPPDAVLRDRKSPTEALTNYARRHGFRRLECSLHSGVPLRADESFELWVRPPGKTLAAAR